MEKCGKCDGCVMPPAFEVDNKPLDMLVDWFNGRRTLSDENLAKVVRLVERRRLETAVLEQAYMKGVCRFPDLMPAHVDVAIAAGLRAP
jgi:hypothetical protein|tara:strand:+ start:1113 stop:1379 length:267 start_codon:yes stop_codon:yes gene_type:complete